MYIKISQIGAISKQEGQDDPVSLNWLPDKLAFSSGEVQNRFPR